MGLTNEQVCNQPVRGGGNCLLDPGHLGHHSTVTFGCDGCNRRRRGRPHRVMLEPDNETIALQFCFLCVAEAERWAIEAERLALKMGAEY